MSALHRISAPRPGWASFVDEELAPCGAAEARYALVNFDDGASQWWVTRDGQTSPGAADDGAGLTLASSDDVETDAVIDRLLAKLQSVMTPDQLARLGARIEQAARVDSEQVRWM
jgi:hypothetical protein